VREAPAVGEERLARIAVGLVLADGVLDVLAVEQILQLGGEDRHAVQEEDDIQALLVLGAVAKLAHHGERVGRQDEVQRVAREESERAVVVVRKALVVAARRPVAVGRRCLADGAGVASAGIGAELEQPALDRFLEGALGDLDAHGRCVPSLRVAR
jgi:hypothetical protein